MNHISEALDKMWNTIITLETNSEGYYAWINDREGTCLCEIDVGLPDLTTVPVRYHTKLQELYRHALKENYLHRLALIEVAEWEEWYNSTRGV